VAYETTHERNAFLQTHRHRHAYAALVVEGGYTECSLDGPLDCAPGTIVVHPAFHAHADRFGRRGARVVNVEVVDSHELREAKALRVDDLSEAREVFERAPHRLAELLAFAVPVLPVTLPAWQQALLEGLRDGDVPITTLARQAGVTPEHASRVFRRTHGMTPRSLRREARWRAAWRLLRGDERLADVATTAGFADQSHLNRVVRAHSGCTPATLRRQIKSVQDTQPRRVVE
jgi:AraC family transcriptional regulator